MVGRTALVQVINVATRMELFIATLSFSGGEDEEVCHLSVKIRALNNAVRGPGPLIWRLSALVGQIPRDEKSMAASIKTGKTTRFNNNPVPPISKLRQHPTTNDSKVDYILHWDRARASSNSLPQAIGFHISKKANFRGAKWRTSAHNV
jgi:hypothetical protein